MNYDEILKKINPTYFSAKGCLGLLAETGDSDIVKFYNSLDKEQLTAFDDNPIVRSRIISLEVRYNMWNAVAEETECQTIVDLPCGYLPHSLITARLNKNYYGFDLPIVIDELSRIAAKFLNEREKSLVQYHGVDATNYSSMRNTLQDVHGEICIITDGLLGFFDNNDLKVVCGNIYRLLQEFGGYWYISDSQFDELMGITYATLTSNNADEMLQATTSGNKKVSDTDNSEHLFLNGTLEERRQFMKDCGFTVKSFCYPDKLKVIPSLKDNPDLMNIMLAAYQNMEVWILTVDEANSNKNFDAGISFTQEFSLNDNVLSIRISGRLDTITAPKLLQKYEEYQVENKFTAIHIDAAELEYISYAGLRVLEFIRETLKDKNLFKINNANDEVTEILNGEIL